MSHEPRYQFDRVYVDRLAAGDLEIEQHFTRYFGDLLTIKLRARLRTPTLIEDVKQETFLRVLTTLRQKGGISSPGGFGAFVNTVCNNILFELYRSHARTTPLDEESQREVPDVAVDAESQIASVEEQAHVRDVLATLPQKEQNLLQWLFFEECDKDEICRRLKVDRDYLRVLVHRAKQRFRSEYVGG